MPEAQWRRGRAGLPVFHCFAIFPRPNSYPHTNSTQLFADARRFVCRPNGDWLGGSLVQAATEATAGHRVLHALRNVLEHPPAARVLSTRRTLSSSGETR